MKLLKNMFYNVSYQLLTLLLPLITVPYVSRVLTPEGVGINAYTNSIVMYFILIGGLGIGLYGNREIAYVQRNKKQRSIIFWELAFLKFASIGIASLLFLIFILSVDRWRTYYLLQGIVLLAGAFDISWYFMGVEDFRKIVLRNTIVKVVIAVLTFVIIKSKNDLGLYISLISLSTLLGNLTVWPFLRTEIQKVKFSELNILRHLRPTVILLMPQITMQIYLSLNKTILGLLSTVTEVGYYDQSDKIVRILFTVVAAIGGVFLPRLASLFSQGNKEEAKNLVLKLIDVSNAISILLMAGLMGVSHSFAIFFFGKPYAPVGNLMFLQSLMIIFISYANALGTQYLLASRRNKAYTISAFVGLGVNLISNFTLIPLFGVVGAIIATVLTEVAVTSFQIWSLRDVFTIKELTFGLPKYVLAGLLTFGLVNVLDRFLADNLISYAVIGLSGGLLYLLGLIVLKAPISGMLQGFLKGRKK